MVVFPILYMREWAPPHDPSADIERFDIGISKLLPSFSHSVHFEQCICLVISAVSITSTQKLDVC